MFVLLFLVLCAFLALWIFQHRHELFVGFDWLSDAGNLALFPGKSRADLELEKLDFLERGKAIASKAETEVRNLNPDERAQITTLIGEAKSRHDAILELDGDASLRDQLNVLGAPVGDLAKSGKDLGGKGQTLGEKFTTAPEFKSWLSSIAPSGLVAESKKGLQSPAMAFGMKDLVTGASPTSAGALVVNDWLGLLDGLSQFQRPLTVVDLVTRGTTTGDTVEYARVTGFTNNAAPTPEASSAASGLQGDNGNPGGYKPQSGLALEKITETVKTIAHWLPATKRSLSDAAQIRTLIDQFLRYGLDEELEDQVMSGDGTGDNFEGILEVSGTQAMPFDTDLLTTTRKARTLVRTVGRARPSAFVFHPNDNERIDLTKNNNGDFYFGGPTSNPSAPLWGLPRVESEAMPEGTGMVADWRMAILWDREQAALSISDSHEDFFIRNLVAVLAEMRAAFGVIRPKAFVAIDLGSGSGS